MDACGKRRCTTPAYKAACKAAAKKGAGPPDPQVMQTYATCGATLCPKEFASYVRRTAALLEGRAKMAPAQRLVAATLRRRAKDGNLTIVQLSKMVESTVPPSERGGSL